MTGVQTCALPICGLGFNTGTPAIDSDNKYTTTNAMDYVDWNGNILKMINDKHNQHLKDMGLTSYSPNEIKNHPNRVVKETKLNELGEYDNKGGTTGAEGLTDAPPKKDIKEGWASIGHPYDRFGDVNRRAKFSGGKPKPTTTKSDEKDDTYKDSKQGGKVKLVKTVKEAKLNELSPDTVSNYVTGAASQLASGELASNRNKEQNRITGIQTGVRKLHPDMYPGGAKVPVNESTEETKMDNKERINEALDCILDNNLSEMKENLLIALQEKAMEKLEERKKEIAAQYFAQ